MSKNKLGKIAYEKHFEVLNSVIKERKTEYWNELSSSEQEAWAAAAEEVKKVVLNKALNKIEKLK